MLVGVPRETKDNEYRVGIVPSTVRELVDKCHRVIVEQRGGAGAGFSDSDYQAAGAEIVPDADTVFGRAELIVKVKEPVGAERKNLRRGQLLFTYLHLAPDRALTEALLASGVTAIAYETVTSPEGALPLPNTNHLTLANFGGETCGGMLPNLFRVSCNTGFGNYSGSGSINANGVWSVNLSGSGGTSE